MVFRWTHATLTQRVRASSRLELNKDINQLSLADWQCLVASVSSESTRDEFYSAIVQWINETPTNYADTDLYDTISGDYPGITFINRPVIGGVFAELALNSAPGNSSSY